MRDHRETPVIAAQMQPKARREWADTEKKEVHKKQLRRKRVAFAAVSLCLGAGAAVALLKPEQTEAVMSHVSTGFEYDDTIGRLQFVSNILPESAMVFLAGGDETPDMTAPTQAGILHNWSAGEPWLEYAAGGMVSACMDGEIMTVVKNRSDEYTVRVRHDGGYESIYSGLNSVYFDEQEAVEQGQNIGMADGFSAFEIRKDGLSVMPVFREGTL